MDKSDVLYDYAKSSLDISRAALEAVRTKLTAVMEISALLLLGLRITSSFQRLVPFKPAYFYYGYLGLKLASSLSLVLAICFGIAGIFPKVVNQPSNQVSLAIEVKMENENLKLEIAQSWLDSLAELRSSQLKKEQLLRCCLIALGCGVFFAAIATFVAFVLAIVEH